MRRLAFQLLARMSRSVIFHHITWIEFRVVRSESPDPSIRVHGLDESQSAIVNSMDVDMLGSWCHHTFTCVRGDKFTAGSRVWYSPRT